MPNVHFLPANRSIAVEKGTTVLEAARLAGVLIESPCNGAVVCGKCAVHLEPDSLHHIIRRGVHHLSNDQKLAGQVLSCEAEVIGDITVLVPDVAQEDLKITSHGHALAVALAPHVTKEFQPDKGVTAVFHGGEIAYEEEGDTEGETFGVVVDIGTTTLVVSLVDLNTGMELAHASALNPQSRHAQDVLSRIRIACEEKGLSEMRSGVIGEINRLIGQVAGEAEVHQDRIYEVVFSGNTCMLHLAAGINPRSLGQYPYTPELTGGCWMSANDLVLTIAPKGIVYLPPIISAYVGADITAGLQAVRLHEEQGTVLFIDIGTNGEMAIVHEGQVRATSTAAGPAFEGMNITFGMRAGQGAIERFAILKGGDICLKTIGNSPATGICGSGLMDIVAELVRHGVINKNGKFVSPEDPVLLPLLAERLVKIDGKPAFKLTDNVYLSQKDVRQVQLAKGAIRAGVEFLLRHTGVNPVDLDKVLIAGSFGFHLTAESLVTIGLLPAETTGKIEFVGNTAKSGGKAFLLNHNSRIEVQRLVQEVKVVELANCADFDRVFVEVLSF
ncbi:ASKHA domain-containing protein [Geotalea sp. SG265]|uniref:ASKHA domain-containing protein n=1 Tax=Geotalea sp. SG265 TaxID=2922867 RepID=UPI001FB02FDC|nr:ASKHA domain-containing protein [Geotalea sp. SG265]